MRRRLPLLPILLAACGASSSTSPPDAAAPDAAPPDSAPPDAACCEDDGIACTRELCGGDGTCTHLPDDSMCAPETCQAACDPLAGGCVARPIDDRRPCGPSAFGGPRPICISGECVPGRVVDIVPFGSIDDPDFADPDANANTARLARIGDRAGDGVDDLAVLTQPIWLDGVSEWPVGAPAVAVYSLPSLSRLWVFWSTQPESRSSPELEAIPDITGDGRSDLVVSTVVGMDLFVIALDATDGNEIWRVQIDAGARADLRAVGDADGDGIGDLIAVHFYGMWVLSGADGSILESAEAPEGRSFGIPHTTPDLDADGREDLALDETESGGNAWFIQVVSSASLDELWSLSGDGEACKFVGGRMGDVTGDHVDELVLTSWDPFWGPEQQEAYDPVARKVIWTALIFSGRVTATFDFDVDGFRDVLGMGDSEPQETSKISVGSGADGSLLLAAEARNVDGEAVELLGRIDQFGDLDADGTDDFAAADRTVGLRVWLFRSEVVHP